MASRATHESSVSERAYCRDARGRFTSGKRPGRIDASAGKVHAGRRPPTIGLTKDSLSSRIPSRLIEDRPDAATDLLSPLLRGKPVWLLVEDQRLPRKTRKYKTMLVLVPVPSLGFPVNRLLVAMPPYGSEILDPAVDFKSSVFARLGLSFSLASALTQALSKLYGAKNGTA